VFADHRAHASSRPANHNALTRLDRADPRRQHVSAQQRIAQRVSAISANTDE
jgi:hypothetical protein